MKIVSITVLKNEAHIMPFFLRHYKPFVDEMIFFDNGSIDGTIEMINECPNTRIINFSTLSYQREEIVTLIRNNAYREIGIKADWFIIVDADELIWHPDIRGYLKQCIEKGITLPRTEGYNMYSKTIPKDDGKSQIWDLVRSGLRAEGTNKLAVVRPEVYINYAFGAHFAKPKGNVKYSESTELKLLHYNAECIGMGLARADYRVKRNKKFYWLSMEVIERDQSGETRGRRVWSREECLKHHAPVFDDEFEIFLNHHLEAALTVDPDSIHQLAMLYHLSHNVPTNYPLGRAYFAKAAELGNPYSQYHMGHLYSNGYQVKKDIDAGLSWFLKAAEQDHADAQNEAGGIYKDRKDFANAIKWLEKAANNGNSQAAYDLSGIHTRADLGFFDAEKVNYWRRLAATQHTFSMYNEAVHHYRNRNFTESFKWAKLAANRGMKKAYRLLDILLEGRLGLPDNIDDAVERFKLRILRKVDDWDGVEE